MRTGGETPGVAPWLRKRIKAARGGAPVVSPGVGGGGPDAAAACRAHPPARCHSVRLNLTLWESCRTMVGLGVGYHRPPACLAGYPAATQEDRPRGGLPGRLRPNPALPAPGLLVLHQKSGWCLPRWGVGHPRRAGRPAAPGRPPRLLVLLVAPRQNCVDFVSQWPAIGRPREEKPREEEKRKGKLSAGVPGGSVARLRPHDRTALLGRLKQWSARALGVPACRSLPVLRTVRDRPALLVPVPLRCPPCRCAPSAPCFGGPAAAWVSCASQGRSLAAGRTPPPPPGIISHPGEQSRVPAAPVWAPSVRCASSGHPHRQALDSTPGWDERRARRWRGKYAAWSVDSHNQWLQNRHSHQNTPKTRQKHAKKARKEKRWQNDGKTMA